VNLYFGCIIFSSININKFTKLNIVIFSSKSNHIIFENNVNISRRNIKIEEISIMTINKFTFTPILKLRVI